MLSRRYGEAAAERARAIPIIQRYCDELGNRRASSKEVGEYLQGSHGFDVRPGDTHGARVGLAKAFLKTGKPELPDRRNLYKS